MPSPSPSAEPIPLSAFFDGSHVQRADIVLMRGSGFFSQSIRWATKSPFSHVALVFVIPDPVTGFHRCFVMEAVTEGIAMRALDEVVGTRQKPGTPCCLLRLKGDWFDPDKQKLVRARLLDFVNAGYDWRTMIGLMWSIGKTKILGTRFREELKTQLQASYQKKHQAPAHFICSGFVQYAFLRALFDLQVENEQIRHAIFEPALQDRDVDWLLNGSAEALAELLATTPEEISQSTSLAWKYVLKNGSAYPVTSRAEAVKRLLR